MQWEACLGNRSAGYPAPQDFAVCWWPWVSCCLLGVSPPEQPPALSAGWISLKLSVSIFEELQLEHLTLWTGVFLEKGKFLLSFPSLETVSSCGSAKLADMGADSPLSGNMGSSFIFPAGSSSVITFTGESVSSEETSLGDKAKGW